MCHVKFDDSRLNNGGIIQLFTDRTSFTHLCAAFKLHIAAEQKRLVTSYPAFFMSIVPDKYVFYPCLKHSQETRLEAI